MTGAHKRKHPSTLAVSDDKSVASPAAKVLETEQRLPPVGVATDRGPKSNQEDAYFVGGKVVKRLTLNGYSSSASGCFGVFDGHCGDRASRYTAENIFPRIHAQLETEVSVGDAITNAVRSLDAEFCGIARRSTRSALAVEAQKNGVERSFAMEDGSTCLLAMIRDGILYVGNVGDSRAVLATRAGRSIAMSHDHKPNRKDERARLEALGAQVTGSPGFLYRMWPLSKMLDVPRVNGALAMSRSIGDVSLKPWVSCDPETTTHKISKDDQFLILASDGLWDVVSSKAAAKLVAAHSDPQEAADALVALALARHTFDNVTAVVVDLESYARSTSRTDVLDIND